MMNRIGTSPASLGLSVAVLTWLMTPASAADRDGSDHRSDSPFVVEPMVIKSVARHQQTVPFRIEVHSSDDNRRITCRPVRLVNLPSGGYRFEPSDELARQIVFRSHVTQQITPGKPIEIRGSWKLPQRGDFAAVGILVVDQSAVDRADRQRRDPQSGGLVFVTQYLVRLEATLPMKYDQPDVQFCEVALASTETGPRLRMKLRYRGRGGLIGDVRVRIGDRLRGHTIMMRPAGDDSKTTGNNHSVRLLPGGTVNLVGDWGERVVAANHVLQIEWLKKGRRIAQWTETLDTTEYVHSDVGSNLEETVRTIAENPVQLRVIPATVKLDGENGLRGETVSVHNISSMAQRVSLSCDTRPELAGRVRLHPASVMIPAKQKRNVWVRVQPGNRQPAIAVESIRVIATPMP